MSDSMTIVKPADERVDTPLGELPREWGVQPLNDVCQINPDSFSADDHDDDTFEYITLSNAANGYVLGSETTDVAEAPSRAKRQVRYGDVLVGTVRPKQRSHGFVTAKHDGKVCSTGFGVLRAGDRVNSLFLWQEILAHRFFRQMMAYVAGSGYPAVKLSDLGKHRIAIPPLDEQRKIASVLLTVDRAIQTTEAIISQLTTIRQGVEQDLLSFGVKADGSRRSFQSNEVATRDTWVGKIPRSWGVEDYGNLVEYSAVGIVVKPSQYYDSDGSVPILRSKNISRDGIVSDDLRYMTENSNQELKSSQVYEGDVVTVRSGDPGLTCVVPEEFDGANCVDILISRPGPKILPEYAAMWINSYAGRRQINRFKAGLAQKHLNLGELRKIRVGLPSVKEQARIAKTVSSISKCIQEERSTLNHLYLLKKGLMQDLLTGRVRTVGKAIEILDEVRAHG